MFTLILIAKNVSILSLTFSLIEYTTQSNICASYKMAEARKKSSNRKVDKLTNNKTKVVISVQLWPNSHMAGMVTIPPKHLG